MYGMMKKKKSILEESFSETLIMAEKPLLLE
jgi:hypothetical protein